MRAPELLNVTARVYLPRCWTSAAFPPLARRLSERDLSARSVVRRCSSSFTAPDFFSTAGGDITSASFGRELAPDADLRWRGASLFTLPGRSRFCVSPPPLPPGDCGG